MNEKVHCVHQQGAILVVSLIVTIVMTTMGIGLFYIANRNVDQVAIDTDRSETLYSAETCIDEVVRWLEVEAETDVPCKTLGVGTLCHSIGGASGQKTMDSAWRTVGESSDGNKSKIQGRMAKHEYTCSVTLTGIINGSSTKYLYKIESEGKGPKKTRTDIEVIASITVGGGSGGGSDVGQDNTYGDNDS